LARSLLNILSKFDFRSQHKRESIKNTLRSFVTAGAGLG
jgi:hypothetical protein